MLEEPKNINIEITGRIPKYFFGVLCEQYREESLQALQYVNDEEIKTPGDLINLIFALSLECFYDPKEKLFAAISKEDLQKFPNLYSVVEDVIENDVNHFEMIYSLFDVAPGRYSFHTGTISLIENDVTISVIEEDDYGDTQKLVDEQSLEEFAESVSSGNGSDDPETDDAKRINQLVSHNPDFGFSDDIENFSWSKNKQGCLFVNDWLDYPTWKNFSEEPSQDEWGVTIFFDDITCWNFFFEFEGEFDWNDLVFVNHSNSSDFHNSDNIVFSHLFYKRELIEPSEMWYRDKGIDLKIGEDRGLQYLGFFING